MADLITMMKQYYPRHGRRTGFLILAFTAVLSGCDLAQNIWRATGNVDPVYDTIAPELPADLGPRPRVLIFSKTNGFRHDEAITAARASVEAIALKRGWTSYNTENGAIFNDEQLAQFDVIFGNNCTGDNWNEDQRSSFKRYMENGGGFVGVHGAAGTRKRFWDWYNTDLLKVDFVGHPMFPQIQNATIITEDPEHPASQHFDERWQHEDEWYSFAESPRDHGVKVLATLDEASYKAQAFTQDLSMGSDHPIIWAHCLNGKGRVFYSALGHEGRTYRLLAHQTMLEGALAWAAGLEEQCF